MADRKNPLSFIRNIFKRDNLGSEDGPRYKRPKYTSNYSTGNSWSNLMVQGTQYDGQGGELQEDLLSRYVDYEDMDDVAELNTALDIISDDATQTDQLTGQIVHIDAEDDKIHEMLDDSLIKNIRIDEMIWEITRGTCKYGNGFVEHVVTENEGLVALSHLSAPQMRRIDDEGGSLLGYVYDKAGTFNISDDEFQSRILDREKNEREYYESNRMLNVFEDWECTHFRLRSKHPGAQYGYSFLEAARWTIKRLNMLEDAALLYKLSRAPQRFVFNVDVGDLPPNESLNYLNKVKQNLKRQKLVDPATGKLDLTSNLWANDEDFFIPTRKDKSSMEVDTVGGFDSQFYMDDLEYFKNKLYSAIKIPKDYLNFSEDSVSKANLCLVPETKIPLLDGRVVTMEQLINEHNEGKQNYVYSIDGDGYVVPGQITNALWTRKNAEVVRVWLDNGEYFDCTPDHPVMMRCGDFVRADNLEGGDSLMPYYHQLSEGKLKGYKQIYDPNLEKFLNVHSIVSDHFNGIKDKNESVHHVDYNKLNNNPENLCVMDKKEHLKLHANNYEHGLGRPEVREKAKKAREPWVQSEENKAICRANLEKARQGKQKEWLHSQAHKDLKSKQMKQQWKEGQFNHFDNPDYIKSLSDRMKKRIESGEIKVKGKDNPSYKDVSIFELAKFCKQNKISSKRELMKKSGYSQTKIDNVMRENNITFENFSNKFMEGGYKICRKGQGYSKNHKVVRVELLQERRNTCDITVDKFHNFALESGVFVHNSQEDIRFSRTVLRVQREMRTGLINMGRIHLASQGVDPDYADFDIYMTPPSSIFEMAMNEVRQSQLDIAESYREWVDDYWIMTNILKFTDEDYEEIQKRLKKQKENEDPFAENRFPSLESRNPKRMNKEVKAILNDLSEAAVEGFLKDPKVGPRLRELRGLAGEMKYLLNRKK